MATTLLQAITTAAKRCGLTNTVSSVIGSTNNNILSLLTKMEEAGKAVRDACDWPELQIEDTIALATDTASYALRADFDRMLDETQWNRDQIWPLYGPITPSDWQYLKSGMVTATLNQRFRVKGFSDAQLFIDPTPDSGYDGDVLAYEFITKTWIKPKVWAQSLSWAGIQYCSYNGNIYDRGGIGAGSTGTTPPTHTIGSVSDGGITWTHSEQPYEVFVHDSDILILDPELVINETVWRWKMEKGFPYEPFMMESQAAIQKAKVSLNGANKIDWKAPYNDYLVFRAREGSFG